MNEDEFQRALRESIRAANPTRAEYETRPPAAYPPVGARARPAVSPRRATPPGAAVGPQSREPGTHPCPGCAKPVLDHLLSCRGCWARLPRTMREAVVRGWTRDHLVAANALADAASWWKAHPAP